MPTAPSSSREIARQAVSQRIQDVAARLFDEQGFAETTVGAIAAEAGISERTFFRYFGAKDDLLFASFAADTQWAIDSVGEQAPSGDPWDTLQSVVEAALERLTADAQRRAVLFQRIAADSPQVQASYLAHQRRFQRKLADALWLRWPSHEDDDRIVLSAVVSSVFAALNEVVALSAGRSPDEQRRLIRATLTAMRPASTGWPRTS